jgi:hypothetical protein
LKESRGGTKSPAFFMQNAAAAAAVVLMAGTGKEMGLCFPVPSLSLSLSLGPEEHSEQKVTDGTSRSSSSKESLCSQGRFSPNHCPNYWERKLIVPYLHPHFACLLSPQTHIRATDSMRVSHRLQFITVRDRASALLNDLFIPDSMPRIRYPFPACITLFPHASLSRRSRSP